MNESSALVQHSFYVHLIYTFVIDSLVCMEQGMFLYFVYYEPR